MNKLLAKIATMNGFTRAAYELGCLTGYLQTDAYKKGLAESKDIDDRLDEVEQEYKEWEPNGG